MVRYTIKTRNYGHPNLPTLYWNGKAKSWGAEEQATKYLTRHTAFEVMGFHCHGIGDWHPANVTLNKVVA